MTEALHAEQEKPLFQLTRELELLISAALVFALLQLPQFLDQWWSRTELQLAGSSFGSGFVLYYVGKLISYGLITAIVSHFLLRGFWVAVMGLRSIYPEGVRYDRLESGPLMAAFYQKRLMTLEQLQSRVDAIASSIFSFIFLFILLFLMLGAWATMAWLIAFAVSRAVGSQSLLTPVFVTVFVLIVLVQSFVATVDRTAKKRPISPRLERFTNRLLTLVHFGTFNFLYAPMFLTFASQSSKRRTNVILVGFMYLMVGTFLLNTMAAKGVIGFDSYVYYPRQSREHQMRPVHYENLRDRSRPVAEPIIQSDVIQDPYIRLFVPYDAREDNARMRQLCPGVKPLRDEGFFFARRGKIPAPRVAELSGCFDRIYEITLDGRPLGRTDFVFFTHPDGGAGRLAMIPAASLPAGRHILAVKHTPLPKGQKDDGRDEFYIPFWK